MPTDNHGFAPRDAILGYLLYELARDVGSHADVISGAGQHAYINTRPWTPDEAKRRSRETMAFARELLNVARYQEARRER